MIANLRNWAGNYTYTAARIHRPQTVEQVRKVIVRAGKLRALGTRHSFNDIADSAEDLISLEHLDRVMALDRARSTVTVEGGIRYGQLGQSLHREGYSPHNLASLPHISVAGACATGTHGSGDGNGNLATAVAAMEVVTADGAVVEFSRERNGPQFQGMVIGLGALGIVTKLTLDIVPAFSIQQDVYENLPLALLEQHFDAIMGGGYSVSLFTDWQSDNVNQIWLKRRVTDGATSVLTPALLKATPAPADRHPIAAISAINCTAQMGVPGPAFERLPHFRMDYTPSSGQELQAEYFVPRPHAVAAIHAISQMRDRLAPLLQISEVRTIAADTLWMSPCYQQACATIHFTWKQDWPAVQKLLPLIEERLAPFGARPHWGKLFTMPPAQLQSRYEKLPEFRQLLQSHDPRGKFRNSFVEKYLFGD